MKKIINPFVHVEGYNCFGCCPDNPIGLKFQPYEDGDEIVATWKPELQYQGWLNTLHGGIQATLLDEVCGWAVMRKLQTAGVTQKLDIKYLKPVICTPECITLRARIVRTVRQFVEMDAELIDAKGVICSRAKCVYYAYPQEVAKRDWHFRYCAVEGETVNEE